MTQLLQDVSAELQDRQRQRAADYRALISAVATGRATSAADIAAQLDMLGKTVAEFQRDVAYMERRLELRKRVDTLPDISRELAELQQEYRADCEQWAKIEKRHQEKIAPLANRVELLERQQAFIRRDNDELRRGYRGPLTVELRASYGRAEEIVTRLEEQRAQRRSINQQMHGPLRLYHPLTAEQFAQYEKQLRDADTRIKETAAELEIAQQHSAEIEAAMHQV